MKRQTRLDRKWSIVAIGAMRNHVLCFYEHDPLGWEPEYRLALMIWRFGYSIRTINSVIKAEIGRHTASTPDALLDDNIEAAAGYENLAAWEKFSDILAELAPSFTRIRKEIIRERRQAAALVRKSKKEAKRLRKQDRFMKRILANRYGPPERFALAA